MSWSIKFEASADTALLFTLEADVRELVLDEVRPGVFAEWSDPRERLGIRS